MNFYNIENLENLKISSSGIDMNSMSKLFKDISKNTKLKTLDDVMGHNIILLQIGEFDAQEATHTGAFKVGRTVTQYAVVAPGKEISITLGDTKLKGKIINEQLILAPEKEFKEIIQKEVAAFKDLSPEEMEVVQWLEVGRTGLSSLSLCAALYPQFVGRHKKLEDLEKNIPHDSADFGRCVAFLDAVPEARSKLENARGINKVWNALIENWSQLEDLYSQGNSSEVHSLIKKCKEVKKPKV